MAQLTYSAEGGSDETNLTTSDTGSGDAFNYLTATTVPKYDTARAAHGALSVRFGGTNLGCGGWTSSYTDNDSDYGRVYVNCDDYPTGTTNWLLFWTVGGGSIRMGITNSGKIRQLDVGANTNDSTNALGRDAWVRIEYHVTRNGSTGLMETKIFLTPDSVTPDETLTWTNRNTGSSAFTEFYVGNTTEVTIGDAIWFDDVVAGAASYPGPAVAVAADIPFLVAARR